MKIWQLIIIMVILRIVFIYGFFNRVNKKSYEGMTNYLKYYKKTTGKINTFYLTVFLIEILIIGVVADKINDLIGNSIIFMYHKICKLTDKTYRLIFSKFEPEEED